MLLASALFSKFVCCLLVLCLPRVGQNSDYVIIVEQEGVEEELKVHRMLLESRSPFFRGMLESNMAEAQQGRFVVKDMLAPVVKAVLFFMYTGELCPGLLWTLRATIHGCNDWAAVIINDIGLHAVRVMPSCPFTSLCNAV